ncbi:MAG: ribosome maturation factor RimM [Coriobacteriia bacterium]|nr:ribosome maturation factor RimM [Coriobacteriia bacterium]
MDDAGYSSVARIVKTHGLKGEVAVIATTATSLSFLQGTQVWLVPPPSTIRTAIVNGVRPGPKGPLLKLAGVEDVGAAALLVGCELLAESRHVPDEVLSPEFDTPDYCGFRVTDPRHGFLGTITETILTGANDVWVVSGPLGEVLIPVIDDVVDVIDEDAETIEVTLLQGLLPEGQES